MTTSIRLATTTAMALGMALLAVPAMAQDEGVFLGRIIVGYTEDGAPIYAGENTSTLEGTAITAQGGTATLDDVLRQTPGVTTLMNQGQPGVAVAIRGMQGPRVDTTIEGVPQNFRFTAHTTADGFAYVDPLLLSSIDVMRGPGAGEGGGMAGSIDFRLLSAEDLVDGEGWGGLARLRYTDNGEGLAGALAAGYVNGPLDLAFAATGRDIDAYENGDGEEMRDTEQEGGSYLLRGAYDVNDALRLSFMAMDYGTTYHSSVVYGGIVYTWYEHQVDNTIYRVGFDYDAGDGILDLSGAVYAGTTSHEHTDGSGSYVGRLMETRTLGFNIQNTGETTFGNWDFTTTNGIDYVQDELSGATGGVNPTGGESRRYSIFSENAFANGPLEVVLGLRYESYYLINSDDFDRTEIESDSLDPRLSVSYRVNDWLQPYLSVYQATRSPTLQEAFLGGGDPSTHGFGFSGNPDLEPEVARGWEVGANIARDDVLSEGDRLTARLAYYDLEVENYIMPQVLLPYGMMFVNIDGSVPTSGVELELSYESDAVSAVLSYAHAEGEYTDADGSYLVQPENALTATVAGHFLDGALTVGTTWTYNSNGPSMLAFDTEANRDAYQLWDLFATYEVTDSLTLSAKVSNVADELYTPWAGADNSGPGRNIYVGAEFRF